MFRDLKEWWDKLDDNPGIVEILKSYYKKKIKEYNEWNNRRLEEAKKYREGVVKEAKEKVDDMKRGRMTRPKPWPPPPSRPRGYQPKPPSPPFPPPRPKDMISGQDIPTTVEMLERTLKKLGKEDGFDEVEFLDEIDLDEFDDDWS